jgi:hypothetical protein
LVLPVFVASASISSLRFMVSSPVVSEVAALIVEHFYVGGNSQKYLGICLIVLTQQKSS